MMNRVNHLKNHKIYTKAPNIGALVYININIIYFFFVILNGLLFKSINSVAINEELLLKMKYLATIQIKMQ